MQLEYSWRIFHHLQTWALTRETTILYHLPPLQALCESAHLYRQSFPLPGIQHTGNAGLCPLSSQDLFLPFIIAFPRSPRRRKSPWLLLRLALL